MSATAMSTDSCVSLTAEARDAFSEALLMLRDAEQWANEPIGAGFEDRVTDAASEWRDRLRRVAEMRDSLFRGVTHLLFSNQDHDGPLRISRDSKGCWFWRYEKSGYHGGLIFHPDHEGGKRLPVGRWSIHT